MAFKMKPSSFKQKDDALQTAKNREAYLEEQANKHLPFAGDDPEEYSGSHKEAIANYNEAKAERERLERLSKGSGKSSAYEH